MEKYREEEAEVLGFEAGSADSSDWPETDLPGMHEETAETGFDEDCSHVQRQKGENCSETKEETEEDNASSFIFSDPRSRWFEFNQFADRIIGRRIDRKSGLRNLSKIYAIKDKFAEEVATRLIREECDQGCLYTKSEVRKRIHAFINLRIRTWLDLVTKERLASDIASSGTVVEINEEGEITDLAETNHEWNISEDRKNPFHQDQLEVMIAKEEEQVLEQALKLMASKRTRRAKEHLAIIAVLLDLPDLADFTIYEKLTNNQKYIQKCQAIKTLSRTMEKLYPVTKSVKNKKVKIRRTPFRILKGLMRETSRLWNENDFNNVA